MNDARFFTQPRLQWQRRYEALRASFVERLPARVVGDRFGYSITYVNLLRHLFTSGKVDFSEPVPEGKSNRHRVTAEMRGKIRQYRQGGMSAGEIAQCLSEDGTELSVRTVERVLREEGFPKLPRRSHNQYTIWRLYMQAAEGNRYEAFIESHKIYPYDTREKKQLIKEYKSW